MREISIIKQNGNKESFNKDKLRQSLLRARATILVADSIVDSIEKEIQPGMTTEDIYRRAFQLLNEKEYPAALTYSIRRSVLNLGPTGFPFEVYVAELLAAQGYKTRTGQMLKGGCIEHEVDVMAWNDQNLLLAEIKFHNQLDMKSDTKTALYVKARFDDLYGGTFRIDGKDRKLTRGLLITNTKFTKNAKDYARCVNTFDIISWDYPEKGNLYDMIEETGLHPMTCLPTLSKQDKQELLKRGILHCRSLKENKSTMREIGVPSSTIDAIVEDIEKLEAHKSRTQK
jgi:hypothetical protein